MGLPTTWLHVVILGVPILVERFLSPSRVCLVFGAWRLWLCRWGVIWKSLTSLTVVEGGSAPNQKGEG